MELDVALVVENRVVALWKTIVLLMVVVAHAIFHALAAAVEGAIWDVLVTVPVVGGAVADVVDAMDVVDVTVAARVRVQVLILIILELYSLMI